MTEVSYTLEPLEFGEYGSKHGWYETLDLVQECTFGSFSEVELHVLDYTQLIEQLLKFIDLLFRNWALLSVLQEVQAMSDHSFP